MVWQSHKLSFVTRMKEKISFRVNDKKITVPHPDPAWLLADFLREELFLTGPKKPCGEGGCGGCTVVMVSPQHQEKSETNIKSINSCLRRVIQCEQAEIYTTEYFSDRNKPAFSPDGVFKNIDADIPRTIANNNGSQCKHKFDFPTITNLKQADIVQVE